MLQNWVKGPQMRPLLPSQRAQGLQPPSVTGFYGLQLCWALATPGSGHTGLRLCRALPDTFRNRSSAQLCLHTQTRKRRDCNTRGTTKEGNEVWVFCTVCAVFGVFSLSSLSTHQLRFRCLLPLLKLQCLGTRPEGRDGETTHESAWKNLCPPACS